MASGGMSNERYCTVLLQSGASGEKSAPPPTQDEILKGLESPKVELKIAAVKSAILGLLQGEKLPKVLMHIIRFCSTHNDHTLKKLLMVFWEVAPKYEAPGKLLPEMILVCNALLNDLNHPNEYIRGSMLRFLCKVKERELLEPLKDAVKANLEHRHAYVRKNAVLAVYTMYKGFGDQLLPDAPELISAVVQTETDASARRNAFLMLFDCAQEAAVTFLTSSMDQVQRFGDGFSLVILELTRKVCRQDPSQKARFVRCIFQLLNSSSPAVSYEASWTLVTLSSAPTAVRAAAKTYCGLLNSQSDNNIKLIVLERLQDLQRHHSKVLQEVLLDMMRALSSPSLDVCRKVLDIALDLVSARNIDDVVGLLKREVVKTQDKTQEKGSEYRHLLITSIHSCASKFPEIAPSVVPVLMEFLSSDGALEVILFVRTMCETYPDLRSSILQKLLVAFPDITLAKVFRVALWILGEYASESFVEDNTSVHDALQTILEAIGALPLKDKTEPVKARSGSSDSNPQPITKSVVLADGTYATETSYSTPVVNTSDDNDSDLRKLILAGDWFLAASISATMAKLCLRASDHHGPSDASVKPLISDSARYMCAFANACPDADSKARILLCIRALLDPSARQVLQPIVSKQCRESYQSLLATQQEEEKQRAQSSSDVPLAQPDDLISFRQLRGQKALGATDIDIDDGADLGRAVGQEEENEFAGQLGHIHQLTGLADPVYAEAVVGVHDYDLVLDVLIINRLPQTLNNVTLDLSTLGDLKLVERPAPLTIGPLDEKTLRASVKVSSTETGHVFGTLVYDSASGAEKTYVNLNDLHLDIMDYIRPATCSDASFRSMWAEFEWENKVAVSTEIEDVYEFLEHIVERTHMKCLTPRIALGDDSLFLAANLYAKSVFGEDALVNLSVEKQENGKVGGYIRIRSKTQGIALSLGDRITSVQRQKEDPNKKK